MDDLRLREALRPLAESISTRGQLESERMLKEGFRDDGLLDEGLIAQSLPWQRADIVIPGAAVAMSAAARVPFPQGAVIRHVSISAGTAPTSTYAITVAAGSESGSFSLQAGVTARMRSASIVVDPGSWVAINVTSAGGAEDVAITLHYQPASSTS